VLRDDFGVAIGHGLGELHGKCFRIGHMGYCSEPMILGTLGAMETTFKLCGVKHGEGGVAAAIDSLVASKS